MYEAYKPCLVCGKPVKVLRPARWDRTKYCSKECQCFARKGKRASKATEFKKGQISHNYKGGVRYSYGYKSILSPTHPRSTGIGAGRYVAEHILVWEHTNGQYLPKDWVVHHINGIKDDNRPENLVGMPRKKHHPALEPNFLKKRIRILECQLRNLGEKMKQYYEKQEIPEDLMQYFEEISDPPVAPAVILDPFMGSGTVGQVAEKLNRNWIGIELNETDYKPIIEKRVAVGHEKGRQMSFLT